MSDHDLTRAPHESLRSLVVGLGLALFLTLIAYALVWTEVVDGATGLAVLALLAALQMAVHLRFFLHLGAGATSSDVNWAIVFALLIVLIVVGGTFWIMTDLHTRMMIGLTPGS